jgi:hypothetical protein
VASSAVLLHGRRWYPKLLMASIEGRGVHPLQSGTKSAARAVQVRINPRLVIAEEIRVKSAVNPRLVIIEEIRVNPRLVITEEIRVNLRHVIAEEIRVNPRPALPRRCA